MQTKSYGSVKITYFDKAGVWKALKVLAQDLSEQHPEIASVGVFGSLARGEAVPGSDVDLLLILDESDLPFIDRASKYRPRHFPAGTDIFAYTREEVERMLAEGNFFLKRALAEERRLFER